MCVEHIEPVTRLGYTESMTDEEGVVLDPAAMGMPVDHPACRLTLTHVGIPAGSPVAAGWQMALDKLDALLADVSA